MDVNNLAYWFPKIRDAGLPVPRTEILTMPDDVCEEAYTVFDGATDTPLFNKWVTGLEEVVAKVGRPAFLRTGHTSGKHDWKNTCFIGPDSDVGQHAFGIIEYSALNSMFGELPWQTWVVREMLPSKVIGVCPRFGDMPVAREYRVFVDGGLCECWNPYWPLGALRQGGNDIDDKDYTNWCRFRDAAERQQVMALAQRAGLAVGGRWSVDILDTERGWFVTDMAEADKSFHWEHCVNAR